MAWLPATGIAGSAVVTLASCRIWIAHWKTVGYWPWESSPTYRYLMAIQLRTSVTRKGFMQSGIAASRPQDQSRCSHPEVTLTSTSNHCTSHPFTVPCEPGIEFAAVHESGSGTKRRRPRRRIYVSFHRAQERAAPHAGAGPARCGAVVARQE